MFGMADPLRFAVVFFWTAAAAASDLKSRRVSVRLFTGYGLSALAALLIRGLSGRIETAGGNFFTECLLRAMPGGLLFLCHLAGRNDVGIGDGLYFLLTGLCLNGREIAEYFILAMFFTFGCAAVMFVRKKSRKTRIPFLTVSAAAFGVMLLCGQ